MEIKSFLFGFFVCLLISEVYHLWRMAKIKKSLPGTLATFSHEYKGNIFFIENISYELGICHLRHNNNGNSLWYKIPLAGSGESKLVSGHYYILDFDSYGIAMFLTKK